MRRFVRVCLCWSAGLVAAVAGVNLAVDPYGVFGMPTLAGFNADKPQAEQQPFLAKAYMVERARPNTLLLGDSRVQLGLDPESEAWPQAMRPVFNLAIGGTNLALARRLLQHSLAGNTPRLVMIGLTLDNAMEGQQVADENDARLKGGSAGEARLWRARFEDMAMALVSLQALTDSALTVLRQGNRRVARMTAQGFNDGGMMEAAVTDEGQHALFRAKERSRRQTMSKFRARTPDLDGLSDMIRMAAARGAGVIVFLTPGHKRELEIIREAGMDPTFNLWKAGVKAVVDEMIAEGAAVCLWDFTSETPYTSERIPAPGDRTTRLTWFWELNHFTPRLGDLIISRVLGGGPADFGTLLAAADTWRPPGVTYSSALP